MIPTYDVNNLTGNLDIMFQNIMKTGFIIAVVLLTIWIVISLLIWLFGARKKSEKAIKFGIKNFITTLVLILIILAIPVLFSLF